MQKTNTSILLAALLALSVSPVFAADVVPAADTKVVQDGGADGQKFTIGSYSEKKKRLAELKLEVDIKEQQDKLKAPSTSFSPSSPVRLEALSTKTNLISDGSSYQLSAIFGRSDNLRAEVLVDGRSYVVNKGSTRIPGWKVDNILSDRINMSNSKTTKEIYLTAPMTSASLVTTPGGQLPAMPPVPAMPGSSVIQTNNGGQYNPGVPR